MGNMGGRWGYRNAGFDQYDDIPMAAPLDLPEEEDDYDEFNIKHFDLKDSIIVPPAPPVPPEDPEYNMEEYQNYLPVSTRRARKGLKDYYAGEGFEEFYESMDDSVFEGSPSVYRQKLQDGAGNIVEITVGSNGAMQIKQDGVGVSMVKGKRAKKKIFQMFPELYDELKRIKFNPDEMIRGSRTYERNQSKYKEAHA